MNSTNDLIRQLKLMDLNDIDEATKVCNEAADIIEVLVKHLGLADDVIRQWTEAYDAQAEIIKELEIKIKGNNNDKRILYPH